MAKAASSSILQLIRGVALDQRVRQLSDHDLLQRFGGQRDEAAFHALLLRHGPMVLEVCRGILGIEADAEDAFQAAFLILARKAASIRKTTSVGSWLHSVAYRTALKARTQLATRQKNEARAPARPISEPDDLSWREVRQVLHEELTGLAERYRVPLVACYLEGKTQDEAAAQLGLAKTTLKERLERARSMLRARLVRRGLGPAAVLVATAWPSATALACLSETLVVSTSKAACLFAAARTVTAAASAKVATLAEGVMKAMFLTKVKTALVVIVTVLGLGTGVGLMTGVSVNALEAQEAKSKPQPTEAAKASVQELIQQLNADEFQKREQATKVLKELGKEIVPQLEAALKTTESAEVRRRLEQLLAPYRPQTDLERLHGTWTLVEMETRGKKLTGKDMIYPFDSGDVALKESLKLFIDGENIHKLRLIPADQVKDAHDRLGGVKLQSGVRQPNEGDVLLNETKKPKQITMAWMVMYWASIYRVEGDNLTLCFNPKTCIRPDEFRTAADTDNRVIFVFKREKPAQEKKGQGVDRKQLDPSRTKTQDNKPVKDDRKRPDLSGTEFPVVPETKKPDDAHEPVVVQEDAQVRTVAWSSNGKILATIGIVYESVEFRDGGGQLTDSGGIIPHSTIKLWDATTGKFKRSLGEEKDTYIAAIAFSADGKTAAISTSKHVLTNQPKNPIKFETEVRVMDAQTWAPKHKVKTDGFASALAFSPDGTSLALGGKSGANAFVRLWDVQKQKMMGETEGGGYRVHCLAFSLDGKQLATGDENGKVRLFDGRTGAARRDFDGHGPLRSGGEQCVTGVGFSPDGKTLVSGSQDKTLKLWDVEKGKLLRNLEGNKAPVTALAFSRDGKLFATAGTVQEEGKEGKSMEVLLWDMKTTKSTKAFSEQTVPVNSLAFSPDGSTLAIGAGAGFNSKVNTETGRAKTPGEFRLWNLNQPEAKPNEKNDQKDDTAWGQEVGGLQAGLGLRPGEHRAYHHGETVTLVVRVRNVGKETVKFQYIRQFLDENPPTVTDADGKTIPLPRFDVLGGHPPVEVSLEPGKETELESRLAGGQNLEGAPGIRYTLGPAIGTGKVTFQYKRVFGNSSAGSIKIDPALSKLATGKLELEVKDEQKDKRQPKNEGHGGFLVWEAAKGLTLHEADGQDKERRWPAAFTAAFSPDGEWVAVAQAAENPAHGKLMIHSRSGPTGKVTIDLISGATGTSCSLVWGADSKRLLIAEYGLNPDERSYRVYDLAKKSTNELKLPGEPSITGWSADGKRLLATLWDAKGGARIAWINIDGTGEPEYITADDELAAGGQLSPDGRRVLCILAKRPAEGSPASPRLTAIDLATKKRTIVAEEGYASGYCWSPDGAKIGYTWQQPTDKPAEVRTRKTTLITCDSDGNNRKTVMSRTYEVPENSAGSGSGTVNFFEVRAWPSASPPPQPEGKKDKPDLPNAQSQPETTPKGLSAVEQFETLQKEEEQASLSTRRAISQSQSDKEKLKKASDEFFRSRHYYARRYLKFAERHPKEPVAIKALQKVFLFSDGASEEQRRAKELILHDHLENKDLAAICRFYGYGFDEDWKKLLERVAAKNPYREPRAHALLALALNFQRESESGSNLSAGREAAKLFEQIIANYADVKDLGWEEKKNLGWEYKLGEIAARELYSLRHLAPGCTAPEIEGKDTNDKPLKLNDFRGKVVLLNFWADS